MKLSHKSLLLICNFPGLGDKLKRRYSSTWVCRLFLVTVHWILMQNHYYYRLTMGFIAQETLRFLLIEISLFTIVSTKDTIKHEMYRKIRKNMIN